MKCRTKKNIEKGAYNNSQLTDEQRSVRIDKAKIKREFYRLRELAQKSPIAAKELKSRMIELERMLSC